MFRRPLIPIMLLSLTSLAGQAGEPVQNDDWLAKMQQFGLFSQTSDLNEYRLGPGDLIEISVFGVDNFNQELRISASGSITIPFLGKLPAGGMTPGELEDELTRAMADQGLIRDPQVSVFIKEYRSQPVYVLGAVNQPGQYMVTRHLTLLDAITMAGGLNLQKADTYALLQRRAQPTQGQAENNGRPTALNQSSLANAKRVDLKALLEDGDLSQNISIEGGDIIQVPERKIDLFYVVGEVGRAGAFEFPREDEKDLLASQALAWAGGPGKTAKISKGILVRYDEAGGRQELAVNFKAILTGKEPDFAVRPNDIIFIPGSTAKTLGYGLLGVIPQTVQGAIIWGPIR